MTTAKKPLVLLIMDGWGYRPDMPDNAVSNANTPVLDQLCKDYANELISASGMDVGLPDGQMGNSEVGHTNIGAGRTVYQNLTKVTKSIQDGDFFENAVFVEAIDKAVEALTTVSSSLAEKLYSQEQSAGTGAAEPEDSNADAMDADFEEVNEDEPKGDDKDEKKEDK